MNPRVTSLIAVSFLGQVVGLALAPPARAQSGPQSAVSNRALAVAGTVSPANLPPAANAAPDESVRCSGDVKVTTRAVSDPAPSASTPALAKSPLPPGVVVFIDAGGLSCVGESSRAPYVGPSQANLTRRLAASDVVETTFPVYRDTPGGLQRARTGVLTLTLSYDTATGALTSAAATLGNPGKPR